MHVACMWHACHMHSSSDYIPLTLFEDILILWVMGMNNLCTDNRDYYCTSLRAIYSLYCTSIQLLVAKVQLKRGIYAVRSTY